MRSHRRTARRHVLARVCAAVAVVAAIAPAASASQTNDRTIHTGPAHLLQSRANDMAANIRSTNWAGYVDTGHRFSVVQASWVQPRVTCTATDSVASFWVGLDGYHSKNVEQAGTLAWCHGGKVTYYSWWQMYPATAVRLVGSTVQPGDEITAAVVSSGSSYTLKVIDKTSPSNSFSRKATCSTCRNGSAEWIAERPSGTSGGLYPLAKFGRVQFYAARVGVGSESGPISKYSHDSMIMINHNGQTMANVTGLQAGGRRFTATWLRGQ